MLMLRKNATRQFNPPKVKQAPYDKARIVDITDEIDNNEEVKPVVSDLEE